MAQTVKQLPAIQESWVRSLGSISREDPLENGMATYFSIFCLENSMDGGTWWAIQSMGSQRVGHD